MNPATLCMTCMQDDSGASVCPRCGGPFDLAPKNHLQLKPRTMLREQYLIGRALGHGGFGVTYLAWDVGLETRLAVKEYLPSGVAGRASGETKVLAYSEATQQEYEWGLDRFLEEARTLKKFSKCPGIVSIDTIFRENGTAYLVMEFLDGWTLEEFIKRRGGKITFETSLRIMLPIIDALCQVHSESVLHRDISPDNIHLTRDGKVKLIDFGAARNALSQKSRNLSIILKEGYAPEEQYRASGIQGPWTDVYATAATIYHSITGVIPQPSLDRLADDQVQNPSAMGIEIDAAAERALMVALSLKASDRFQSMEDFKAVLTGSATVTAIMGTLPKGSSQVMDPRELPSTRGQFASPPAPLRLPTLPPPPPALHSQAPPAAAKPTSNVDRRWIVPGVLGAVALIAIVVALTMHRPIPTPVPTPTPAPAPAPAPEPAPPVSPPANPPDNPPQPEQPPPPDPTNPSTPNPGDPNPANPRPSNPNPRKTNPRNPDPSNPNPSNPNPGNPNPSIPPPVAPAPDFSPPVYPENPGNPERPRRNPGGPPSNVPAGDYDSLMSQAKIAWAARQFNQVQTLLRQGIQMDPNKPRAYSGLGELQLYVFNNIAAASRNDQAAVSRGGEAVFHVRHDHSSGTFTTQCTGKLYISQAGVRFVPDTGSHSFNSRREDVREGRRNRGVTFGIRQKSVELHPFHIRLANGQNYNLAPSSRSAEAERDLILLLLGEH